MVPTGRLCFGAFCTVLVLRLREWPETKKRKVTAGQRNAEQSTASFVPACHFFLCLHGIRFLPCGQHSDGFLLLSRIFSFRVDGKLSQMAAAMEPSEIYIVTKALSLIAPSLVGAAQIAAMMFLLAVSFFVLSPEKHGTDHRAKTDQLRFHTLAGISVRLVRHFPVRSEHLCLF